MAYRGGAVQLAGPETLGFVPLVIAAVPAVMAAVPAISKLIGKKKKKRKKKPPPPPPPAVAAAAAAAPGGLGAVPGWIWPVAIGGGSLAVVGALVFARRR